MNRRRGRDKHVAAVVAFLTRREGQSIGERCKAATILRRTAAVEITGGG
jgi:hypothetical protein